MTDMEKRVMVRLCAKILLEADLYDTDMEVRNLIDWIYVSAVSYTHLTLPTKLEV